MKKYLIVLFTALSFALAGCEETDVEAGGTAIEKMAGTWYVTWESKGNDGVWNTIPGSFAQLDTYNTAANVPTEMWMKEGSLLNTAIKVSTNCGERTFSLDKETELAASTTNKIEALWGTESIIVTIADGKILAGAAKTPSGMPADSIVLFVNVKGDEVYKITGFRRTGFSEDE